MSSEQPLDPQLIEQTKQQIRTLVNEIAQLSKSDSAPEEFHAEFLPRVVSALAAIGGAVWTFEEQGRLVLQHEVNLRETKLRESEEAQVRHGRLLQKAVTAGEDLLVAPHSGAGEQDEAGNPTGFLIVLGCIKTELETVGLVEVFQRPDAGPNTQKGYVRFLRQMCDLAGEFFKNRQLRHFGDRQTLWTQLEEFTRNIHTSLDPRETAYTVANEGRRLIECDRVSVALRKGRKCTIESVSGQDMFDKRSNTVRLLGQLATAVVASGEPIWYTGDTTDMAPQVEDALQEYVDDSHSKMVAVLPLCRPQPELEDEDEPDKRRETDPPFGALIVEQIEDNRIAQTMRQRVDVVGQHAESALGNSLEHNSLFLMPLWRTLGKAKWVLQARTLPKTIAITIAVLAVLVAMFVVRYPFKLHSTGKAVPVERHDVFAGIQGRVTKVHVKHDDEVAAGELLVELYSRELEMERLRLVGEGRQAEDARDAAQRRVDQLPWGPEKIQARGEVEGLRLKIAGIAEQLDNCALREKELMVLSPMDGAVMTWRLHDLLDGRPIERGQKLLWVADREGVWELELHMPEKRLGHIQRARAKVKAADPDDDLDVQFVLATDPGHTLHGKVREIHAVAEVRGEEGNTVLIRVSTDAEVQKILRESVRPGAEVSAKVDCGMRPVGYVLLHDFIGWVQKAILFRF